MEHSTIARFMVIAGVFAMALMPLYGEKMPRPRERAGAGVRGMRRNAMVWRAFAQLSNAERKKLHELQRSNPEKFAAEMRKLADRYEAQERARIQKLQGLIDKYRRSTDEAERAKLKAEVSKMEKMCFDQRLAGLSRTIANAKRRVTMMEQEFKKRKAKANEIVEARVDALLSGELPVVPFPPRRNMPPRPPRHQMK